MFQPDFRNISIRRDTIKSVRHWDHSCMATWFSGDDNKNGTSEQIDAKAYCPMPIPSLMPQHFWQIELPLSACHSRFWRPFWRPSLTKFIKDSDDEDGLGGADASWLARSDASPWCAGHILCILAALVPLSLAPAVALLIPWLSMEPADPSQTLKAPPTSYAGWSPAHHRYGRWIADHQPASRCHRLYNKHKHSKCQKNKPKKKLHNCQLTNWAALVLELHAVQELSVGALPVEVNREDSILDRNHWQHVKKMNNGKMH